MSVEQSFSHQVIILLILTTFGLDYIEEIITWPSGDTKFLFECWNILIIFTSEWSERVKYFFNTRRDISYLQAAMSVMFYLLYKHQLTTKPFQFNSFLMWKGCSHSNGDIFTCEDNMLFSHVKIWSFRVKAHLVFHWCLSNK